MIYSGRVKWFNDTKGFGMIEPKENDRIKEDVFVHHSAVMMQDYRTLEEGQRVRFSVAETDVGLRANHVTSSLEQPGWVY